MVLRTVSCLAFSASAGGGGAGTAALLVVGTAAGGAGAGWDGGVPGTVGGRLEGGTIRRVNRLADCADTLETRSNSSKTGKPIARTLFIGGRNVPHPACVGKGARGMPDQSRLALRAGSVEKRVALLIVHVHVQVRPECVEAFRQATLENARNSVKEPGIARFDLLQQADDPTQFVLVEVYRNADAPAQHKATAHYAKWREVVAPMMAKPRDSVKLANLFPDDGGWG